MKTVSLELGKQKPKYARIAQEQYAGSQKAQEKKKRLEKIEELVLGGCPRDVAIKPTGIGRRTDYTHESV